MATPFDQYPYTNFHELNLAYFIVHFREIFAQWAELYDTLTTWKTETDEDLAAWKDEQETTMQQWETNLLSELDQWKAQTRLNILDWEVGVIAALDEWKAAFQTLFDTTFSNLSDIKTDAEAARDAALAAQAAAEAAAHTLVIDPTFTNANQAADAKVVGIATGYHRQSITTGYYIATNGSTADISTPTESGTYEYAVVSCLPGDRFTVTGTGGGAPRLWAFIKSDGTVLSKADASVTKNRLPLIAPANAAYLVFNSLTSNTNAEIAKGWTVPYVTDYLLSTKDNVSELQNTLDISDIAFTDSKYITTPAVGQTASLSMSTSNTATCAYKQCYKGERFRITGTSSTNSGRCPWAFTDSNLKVLIRHQDSVSTTYTDHEIVAPADGYLILNFLFGDGYTHAAQTGYVNMAKTVADTTADLDTLEAYVTECVQQPLTELPDYILNNAAYKPLGAPDTGYFCLVTDDGKENGTLGVASYTIPMVIAKGIPCTFALMETSEVFTNASWIATLVDAVSNHNCSVAVHGVQHFTEYTEKDLADYLIDTVDFLETQGITNIAGAVCPAHIINKRVMAVAGGLMGVVRSGYRGGTDADIALYDGINLDKFCNYYTSGANSNLYGLSSFNIAAKTLAYSKAAIDYAKSNNKILIALYHENSTDLPDAEAKAKVEDVIDYALAQNLTFITLGDIAKLPIADPSTY